MAGQLLGSITNATRTFWSRMTSTRLTTIYFVFALINCGVQTGLQTRAFLVNKWAAALLDDIVLAANQSDTEFAVFSGTTLELCMGVPGVQGNCELVWESTGNVLSNQTFGPTTSSSVQMSSSTTSSTSFSATHSTASSSGNVEAATVKQTDATSSSSNLPAEQTPTTTLSKSAVPSPSPTTTPANSAKQVQTYGNENGHDGTPDNEVPTFVLPLLSFDRRFDITPLPNKSVDVSGVPLVYNGMAASSVNIEAGCARVLLFPLQNLNNIKRTDAVFIAFQIWVLGMSILALLNESIPHVAAAFFTHLFATAYTAYQLVETADFRGNFLNVTLNGACAGMNLLPDYWQQRGAVEIPMLAINCAGLLFSAFLTWRLVKRFGWQTFKRIGASLAIHRYYTFLLLLSVSIQLSAFFVIAFLGLWIDQLNFGSVGQFDSPMDRMVFEVIYIVLLVLIVPWLISGWYAVYREKRYLMVGFLAVTALLVIAWGLMFVSLTYRWTFISWPFFAVLSSITAFLVVITLGLGIICALNFRKGLLDYLRDEPVDDTDPFMRDLPRDTEKIHFPSSSDLPTFSSRPPSVQITSVESNDSSVAEQPRVEFYQPIVRTASIASDRSASSNASGRNTSSGTSLNRVESKGSSNSGRSGTNPNGRGLGRFLLE